MTSQWQGHARRAIHILLAACFVGGTVRRLQAATSCENLGSVRLPATSIELPTRGGEVTAAEVVAASAATVPSNGAFIPATPAYCKVLGSIAPVDASAPLIRFQLNLPLPQNWNGKMIQFGGGGFNGTLVTGLNPAPDALPAAAPPLALGYITLGTDSGHQSSTLPEIQAFALNDEALVNFAYAAYKKVRDAAVALAEEHYGRRTSRIYYVGTSEGGREGLTMAQRFPRDYDGVIARVPVINWTGLQHAGMRNGLAAFGDGWLAPQKVRLLADAVLRACDGLDGLTDGIVSNYLRCGVTFDANALRCATGRDEGNACLSDAQLATVRAIHAPYRFSFPLANGVTQYPPFPLGGEAQPGAYPNWVSGTQAPTWPAAVGTTGQQWNFGNAAIRYFVLRDPQADPRAYSPDAHKQQVLAVSALMDSTNPDLRAFAEHGGKIILKEHLSDYAQSPAAGFEYYQSVVSKMGQSEVDNFFRLFVAPGATHGGIGIDAKTDPIPQYADLLSALDRWVEWQEAPTELVQSAVDSKPPFTITASKPLCRYPKYPRYKGAGSPTNAASFECVSN